MTTTFGIIGDIHGNFDALDRIMGRRPEIPFWLCVGDVASVSGAYPEPVAPLYWVKGNNESFDRIAAWTEGRDQIANLHYIPNGTGLQVGALKVAGVGGTFAPSWYATPAAQLPVRGKDDKRRHFVREEIVSASALTNVDVLLTHEAPKPFFVELPSVTAPSKRWRRDVGKIEISELADRLQPRLHCFGHHHVYAASQRAGIPTICVDRVNRSYLIVDRADWSWRVEPTDEA